MFDAELEDFKTKIDIRHYAAAEGYQLDSRNSSGGSACMRHPATDDKIFIGLDARDKHYVYWSVRDDADKGSIIDFIQRRKNLSLGALRKELRPWIGAPAVPVRMFTPLVPTTKDRMAVLAEYELMSDALRHPYLEKERALPASLLQSPRFAGTIRVDARGNAIFPHKDQHGVCGYEVKNSGGFTGFAKGGEKGLWSSHDFPDDRCIVFCESAIDAASYAALFSDEQTRYRSIGGKPNPQQPGLVLDAIVAMPPRSKIVAGMDADEDGRILVGVVRQAFEFSGRNDLWFHDHEPVGAKDWNDILRSKQPDFFPAARALGLKM